MATKKKMLEAAAGTAAAGGASLDITEVFSTYVYDGTTAAHTITNGIDLAGEGGMTWIKSRTSANTAYIYDTERGATTSVTPSDAYAQESSGTTLTAFNSNGFSLGSANKVNGSSNNYASWTFRKAPKFFDVVTYTGTGSAQNISHSLDSVPGMIIVKSVNSVNAWTVYHRGTDASAPANYSLALNYDNARDAAAAYWNNTAPTSSVFTVGTTARVNNNGDSYVAYVFAHNDGDGTFGPDGDQDIIKCGSYAHAYAGTEVNLGFEPQWILFKAADQAKNWYIFDAMRGIVTGGLSGDGDAALFPNTSDAENVNTWGVDLTATGFIAYGNNIASSGNIIYMAIRRGPLALPEAGTEVFDISDNPTDPNIPSNILVDSQWFKLAGTPAQNWFFHDRLRQGSGRLDSSSDASESSGNLPTYLDMAFDRQTGVTNDGSGFSGDYIAYHLRRAPSFYDCVAFSGNSTAGRTVSHNLGVAPEMIWVKSRTASNQQWRVYHSALGATKYLDLNQTIAAGTWIRTWNDTEPTSSVFTLGNHGSVNDSGATFISYLFASLDGVSKVSSYTGNGSSQTINAGFTTGARFILIKRTDSTGDWYVWDTVRGIVAGNDPHLSLNTTAAEVTSDDSIDPHSSGFIVNQVAATNINVSSATYIYYAVA